jgi:hypothetical protein
MIAERVFPRSVADLHTFVADKCRGAGTVTMQAGHFLLHQSDGAAEVTAWIDGHGSSPADPMREFPLLTWRLGLDLLLRTSASHRYIATLVNDWQYVVSDDGRQRFYRDAGKLPASFAESLHSAKGVSLLRPSRPRKGLFTGDFFSEQTLRNQYRRHVKRLIREARLPAAYRVESDNGSDRCEVRADKGSQEVVYCAGQPQTCTHEVAQFVYAIGALTRSDVLINLYPIVCRNHVEAGTDLGLELFSAAVQRVINVAVPPGHYESIDDAVQGGSVSVHIP